MNQVGPANAPFKSPLLCPGDLQLIGNQCKCPDGTHGVGNHRCEPASSGGAAILPPPANPPRLPILPQPAPLPIVTVCTGDRPNGIFPNCCPLGTNFQNGVCRPPVQQPTSVPVCSGNTPVGTFPNCCPNHSQFTNGKCQCLPGFELVPGQFKGGICVPHLNTGGTNGTQPSANHNCPPGYKVLDAPNKYGAYCEAPIECDKSMGEVLYPDGQCSCPVGQGRYGPNHLCAPPPAEPAPVGPTPKHTKPPPQCNDPFVLGTNGQCICAAGTKSDGKGGCALIVN